MKKDDYGQLEQYFQRIDDLYKLKNTPQEFQRLFTTCKVTSIAEYQQLIIHEFNRIQTSMGFLAQEGINGDKSDNYLNKINAYSVKIDELLNNPELIQEADYEAELKNLETTISLHTGHTSASNIMVKSAQVTISAIKIIKEDKDDLTPAKELTACLKVINDTLKDKNQWEALQNAFDFRASLPSKSSLSQVFINFLKPLKKIAATMMLIAPKIEAKNEKLSIAMKNFKSTYNEQKNKSIDESATENPMHSHPSNKSSSSRQ